MSRNRFRAVKTPNGRIIVDRKTGAWYLVRAGRILDYGRMRDVPAFLALDETEATA